MAYSQDGPGHYDLAIQSTTSCMDHKQKSSRKHCSCARHRFYQGSACMSRSDTEGLPLVTLVVMHAPQAADAVIVRTLLGEDSDLQKEFVKEILIRSNY